MNTNSLRALLLVAIAFLSISAGSGCAASSQWMHEVKSPASLPAPGNNAVVVVLRPSSFGEGVRFTVMDDKGAFLGQPLGSSYYALTLPPGRYTFVASAENADMVRADLIAGKTYYLLASVRMGMWSARVGLTALTTRSEQWVKREEWLRKSTYYEVDLAGGNRQLREHEDDVRAEIASATEAWSEYDEAHRAERMLRPEDGL